jgi:hypothetical protein
MLRAMKPPHPFAFPVAVALALLAGASGAESIVSSASSAGSESVGSLSDSIGHSSDSATGGRADAGTYRVVALADAPDGRQRVRLAAVDDAARSFDLLLPRRAATLAPGESVEVEDRPYGLAFKHVRAPEPFFVALADDWRDDLSLRPVVR